MIKKHACTNIKDILFDRNDKNYAENISKEIECIAKDLDGSLAKVMLDYKDKFGVVSGILYAEACRDLDIEPEGYISAGFLSLAHTIYDDVIDNHPENPEVCNKAADILAEKGVSDFDEKCKDKEGFEDAKEVLLKHYNNTFEWQQKDLEYFEKTTISKEEYFDILNKTREWIKIGVIPAAVLARVDEERYSYYDRIAGHIGNLIQLLDDTMEIEDDIKHNYCSYFSYYAKKHNIEDARKLGKQMIEEEIIKANEILDQDSALSAFISRFSKTSNFF